MNFSLDTNLFEKRVFCWKDGGRERETCVSNITINANAKIQQYVKFQVCGKRHGGANLWSWDKHDGCQRHDMRMCLSGFHCFEMISILFEDGRLTMITFLSGVGAACTGVCNACQLWRVRGEERCKVDCWWYYLDWSLAESSNSGSKRITKNVCVIKRNTSPTILGVTSLLNSLLKICTDVFSDIIQVSAQRELWHSPVHWAGDIVLKSFRWYCTKPIQTPPGHNQQIVLWWENGHRLPRVEMYWGVQCTCIHYTCIHVYRKSWGRRGCTLYRVFFYTGPPLKS